MAGFFSTGALWDDGAGAAEVLTAAYVAGDAVFLGGESELWLEATTAGTAMTRLELQVEWKRHADSDYMVLPLLRPAQSDGVVQIAEQTVYVAGANGNHPIRLKLPPYTWVRVKARRVGGDGTSTLLLSAQARAPQEESASGSESAAYDSTSGTLLTTEQAGPETVYDGTPLLEITNGTDGTTYAYMDMETYTQVGWQMILNGGSGTATVTVEASWQNDGTAQASCAYEDMTYALFGVTSFVGPTGATANFVAVDNTGVLATAKYVRLKLVLSTGGADDADATVYHGRIYA